MYTHKKLMTGCCVAVLTFGLAACSSGGGDDDGDDMPQAAAAPSAPTGGGTTTTPPVTAEPTELEAAQIAAAKAAEDAMTASDAAAEALARAVAAGENHATLQTTCCGVLEASEVTAKAKEHADAAMAAYELAKAAAAKAAAAELVTVAVEARIAAEAARDVAVAAAAAASKAADDEEEATIGELKIVGTMKTVGETTLDAAAGSSVVTTNDKTEITGLLDKSEQPTTTVAAVPGAAFVEAMPEADPSPIVGVTYKQTVAAHTFPIGKTVDSANDMARLMIVDFLRRHEVGEGLCQGRR